MVALVVLTLAIILIVILNNKNWKYNPVFIFNGIWFVVFFLYLVDFLNLDFVKVEGSSVEILIIMIVFFSLGGLAGRKNRITIRYNNKNINECYQFREIIFFIISVLAAVVMLIDEIEIIIRLINGSTFYNIIKDAKGKETVIISGARQIVLYLFVVYPVTYMISPICATQFFSQNKKKKYYLLINVIVVALSIIHHGGRNSLFLMMISYMLVFTIKSQGNNVKKRTKIIMILGLILSFVLINGISESRGIESVWESFYAYMTCSIPLMQSYLKSGILKETYLYGYYSFNGLIYPVANILKYLGIPNSHLYELTQMYRVYVEESMNVIAYSYNHRLNAFMPAGAYLFVDGGYFLEAIGMFLYGFISGNVYRKISLKKDDLERNLTIYCMIVIGLILSFSRFWFTSYGYTLGFIYIFFLFKKDLIKENGK